MRNEFFDESGPTPLERRLLLSQAMPKLTAFSLFVCLTMLLGACAAEPERVERKKSSTSNLGGNTFETWAFCGVDPHNPNAQKMANNMARVAGIDATMGPCRPAPAGYTPAAPGSRYVTPEEYLAVAWINSAAGMKTIVYDARMWSDDPAVRQAGYDFWAPHFDWVRAWDMGDEFDPAGPEWEILKHRWSIMIEQTMPATGIGPFTNHLGNAPTLERALADLPLAGVHLSFDLYDFPAATDLAAAFYNREGVSHLMCAANALAFGPAYVPTAKRLGDDIKRLRFSGCGSILVFGGAPVVDGAAEFGSSSLVDERGNATSLASAVRDAAR